MTRFRRYLGRVRKAAGLLLPERPDPIRKFFSSPYSARVAEVQHLYRHEVKKAQLGEWFEWDKTRLDQEIARNFRPYFDILVGYSRVLKPGAVLQLGAFTMTESQWLVADAFPGRIIASDYNPEHVEYLKNGFAGGLFGKVEFRVVDIEQAKQSDLADIGMVVAIAVFSNIQPEGVDRFFGAMAKSPVQCALIGDMYMKQALTVDSVRARSVPIPNSRNWSHPYLAIAKKHGFDAFFLPDFTYSSFMEARGVFVIHRQIPQATHTRAISEGLDHYIARQDGIWRQYAADSYTGLDAAATSSEA